MMFNFLFLLYKAVSVPCYDLKPSTHLFFFCIIVFYWLLQVCLISHLINLFMLSSRQIRTVHFFFVCGFESVERFDFKK